MAISRNNNPLPLVDYSSEDEDDSTIQQTDIERKRQKTPREAMMAST